MTDAQKLLWLQYMIVEEFAKIEYTIRHGCLCGSCYEFVITWSDIEDKEVYVQDEDFGKAIEAGFAINPGWAK